MSGGSELARDASHDDLVAALELNWRTCVGAFGQAPTTEVRDDDELFWYVTGLPAAPFNSVMYANLAPERIDAAVAELRALRAKHGVPINWLVGPSSRPVDLGAQLLKRGLQRKGELKVMTIRADGLTADEALPAGLAIEAVASAATYQEWIDAELRGFEMEGALAEGFAALRRAMGRGVVRHFLGELDGAAVATASVLLAGGVAGVYDVSTVPAARGRGIGRALTLRALAEARDAGYAWAFLQPSPRGEALYRRIGFGDRCVCTIYG